MSSSIPPSATEVAGWTLYAPRANQPSPLTKTLNGLERTVREALLQKLQEERDFLNEFGQNGAREAKRLRTAWGQSGQPAERGLLHFIVSTPSRTAFAVYVAIEDGVPVLLHAARNYGDKKIHRQTEEAAKRLRDYRSVQLDRVAASDPDRVFDERPSEAAVLRYTVVERTRSATTRPERVTIDLSGNPFTVRKFEHAKVRELIELQQEVTGRYVRVISSRKAQHDQLLSKAREQLAVAEQKHGGAAAQLRRIAITLTSTSNAEVTTTDDGSPVVHHDGALRKAKGFLRSLVARRETDSAADRPVTGDTMSRDRAAALEEEFAIAVSREKSSLERLAAARDAFRQWNSFDVESLETTSLDAPDTIAELTELRRLCPRMRALAIEVGTRLLEDPEFAVPVVRAALGDLSTPSRDNKKVPTQVRARDKSSSERLALLAADIVCFHTLQGLPLDGSVPAYGTRMSYPEGKPVAIRDTHVRHVFETQQSRTTVGVRPGDGLDATFGRPASRDVRRVEHLVIFGEVPPRQEVAAEMAASLA